MSSKMLLSIVAAAVAAAAGRLLRLRATSPALARVQVADTHLDPVDETLLDRLRRRGF